MPEKSATSTLPRVMLPVGNTSDFRPRIEWKWTGNAQAWQVRVRLANYADEAAQQILWESSVLPGDRHFAHPDVDLSSHESLAADIRAHSGGKWTPWGGASLFRIEPVQPLQGSIAVYDLNYTRELTPLQAFAHAHLVSALQGLVNRHEPGLYVKFVKSQPRYRDNTAFSEQEIDELWLQRMTDRNGGWLAETSVRTVTSLADLLDIYGDAFNGAVVWDTAVPATSNIASIIAGADDLLPVPCSNDPAGLYTELIARLRIPVAVDLRGKFTGRGTIPGTKRPSTGSAKCDAYLWAVEKYLLSGKSNPAFMGHYIDGWWLHDPTLGKNWQNHTLTNHDFFIARRGFFWDLNVWADETPIDDPDQPLGTDAATLREIMAAANGLLENQEMIHVGGFTPWAFKYTNFGSAGGTHEPVPTEWELVRVLSAYNAYVDADALGMGALANASFLCHFPLSSTYAPVLAATPDELRDENLLLPGDKPAERNFILNYVGDYDSAAWAWNTLTHIWESPDRGKIIMAWAVNPNLVDRAAPLFDYLYRTRTADDHFMTGDSGAGYINPTQLHAPRDPSNLPDATAAWLKHSLPWYRRFGLRFTGFLINGLSGHITPEAERMYVGLSPDGIVNQYGHTTRKLACVSDCMPAFELLYDLDELDPALEIIDSKIKEIGDAPRFMVFRQILKKPEYYREMFKRLTASEANVAPVFCEPHTFGCLARAHLGAANDDQAMLLFSAIPGNNVTGSRSQCDIAFRNDGWNTWTSPGHTLLLQVVRYGSGDILWQRHCPLPHDVRPGESVLFRIQLPVPDFQGRYVLTMDMARDGVMFSDRCGYPGETTIIVRTAAPPITV